MVFWDAEYGAENPVSEVRRADGMDHPAQGPEKIVAVDEGNLR